MSIKESVSTFDRDMNCRWFSTVILLRSSRYGLPQTRDRVYIIMVDSELLDAEQMTSLSHVITETLPSALTQRASLQQVRAYVASLQTALDQKPTLPSPSKDRVRARVSKQMLVLGLDLGSMD